MIGVVMKVDLGDAWVVSTGRCPGALVHERRALPLDALLGMNAPGTIMIHVASSNEPWTNRSVPVANSKRNVLPSFQGSWRMAVLQSVVLGILPRLVIDQR